MAPTAISGDTRGNRRPRASWKMRASKLTFKPEITTIWISPLAIMCCCSPAGKAAR